MKSKGFFEVDAATAAQEKNRPRFTLHSVRNIYKGVKIPWGKYILAAVSGAVFYAIAGSSAGVAAKIASGDFSNLGDIVTYAVISILGLGTVIAAILLDFANFRLGSRERSKLWRKILRLPADYFDRESPNRIITRITSDTDAALVPFSLSVIILVLLATMLGVIASMGDAMGTPMTKWLLTGVVFMVIFTVISLIMLIAVGFLTANRLSAFTSFLSERLANFKLIKASQSEKKEMEAAHRLIENRYKADLLGVIALLMSMLSASVILLFSYIGCFLLGWGYYSSGAVTDGQTIVKFYAFATGLGSLVSILGVVVSAFGTGAGQAATFAALFDEKEEDLAAGNELPAEPADLVLENVDFSYNGSRNALSGISCRIEKGSVTAIVGTNGSGKSTLTKVLDRLYTDVSGELRFGDIPASEISLRSWRNRLAVVSQNASLFSGTIRDNVCYGLENVSDAELEAACRLSGLEPVLAAHEEGLSFEVGIGGCKLSGGEQQRIAIARAILKNPDYLILDEATANLDAKTARELRAGLDELMKGRTVVTIAHDYETIRKADHIIVMHEGRILAQGTHEALLESCGFYQQLYRAGFEV